MKTRKISRARALLLDAVLAGGVLVPVQAWGQVQDRPEPPQGTAVQSQDGSPDRSASQANTGIEEIVVTAEKRAEGLENIPIAISAFTGNTLQKAGVTQVGDLVQLAPSLQFGTRSTNVFIAMRGIGQAGQDIGSQSGVTVSLDGVPLLNHFMMNPSFLDVERVEVLRGPQGTIQGRNATGGAINVYSRAPTDEFGGEVSLTAGNYSRFGTKGVLNVPLSDRVDARIAFQTDRADGWLRNAYLNRRNDDADLTEVRGSLLARPTDTLTIRALLDYTRDRSDPSFNVLLGRADPARPAPNEVPGYAFPSNDIDDLTVYFNEPNRRNVEDVRATLIGSLDLGGSVHLTSTTGYIRHDIDLTDLDVDLTPVVGSRFDLIGLYAEQETQEFTATADLGDRADLVAGLFYMHGDSSEPLYLSTATVKNSLVYLPSETLDSYAAYAQLRYKLTHSLRATIGGRYTIDDKSYAMDAMSGGNHYLSSDDGVWRAFTPRFALDYTLPNDALLYASVSRGFKSGGFNTLGDVTLPVNIFNPEYVWNYELGLKAAFFDRRLRLSLTGFYADYTNLQQTVFRINEQTGVRFPRVENSSTAKIKGIEFEFEAAPVAGLRLTGAATYLSTEYGAFCNNDPLFPNLPTDASCVGVLADGKPLPPGAINLKGNVLTQAPEWQFNTSAQYVVPISSALSITARADYKWQSRVYFDIYNNPLNSQDSYGLLNASLGIGTADGNWSLTGWIRNAFDERYISQGVTRPGANPYLSGSIGTPRMYGATLFHSF